MDFLFYFIFGKGASTTRPSLEAFWQWILCSYLRNRCAEGFEADEETIRILHVECSRCTPLTAIKLCHIFQFVPAPLFLPPSTLLT